MRFLLALLILPAAAHAQSNWNGPLPAENARPLNQIFLHLSPTNPDVLDKNQSALGVQLDIANNLLIPAATAGGSVEEDFETQRLMLNYRRGLGRNLEARLDAQLIARNGGILDGFIQGYHDLFGLEGNGEDNPIGRANRAKGRSVFAFRDVNGRGINQDSAFGLGDTTLSLQRQISSGKLASAARLGVKLPTGSGNKVLGSGGLDAGLGLDARYQFARNWALFGSAGAYAYGGGDVPNAKNNGLSGGLGFERRVGKSQSVIAQIDAQTRAVATGNAFADRTPVIASVGYKRQWKSGALWAFFSENGDYTNYNAPFFGNIAPDLTFRFGYEFRRGSKKQRLLWDDKKGRGANAYWNGENQLPTIGSTEVYTIDFDVSRAPANQDTVFLIDVVYAKTAKPNLAVPFVDEPSLQNIENLEKQGWYRESRQIVVRPRN